MGQKTATIWFIFHDFPGSVCTLCVSTAWHLVPNSMFKLLHLQTYLQTDGDPDLGLHRDVCVTGHQFSSLTTQYTTYQLHTPTALR